MYPYNKENLVDYRLMMFGACILFFGAVICGVLFHRFLGLWVMLLTVFYAIQVGALLFRWHPEPTAKRQIGVLLAAMIAYGAITPFAVDLLISEYHVWRGECSLLTRPPSRCDHQ